MEHSFKNDLPFVTRAIILAALFIGSLVWQNIKDGKWFKKDINEEDDHKHHYPKDDEKRI